jgi:hypothetical protein
MSKKIMVEVGAVEVELSDKAILKATAEIWNEDATKCMGNIIAYASELENAPVGHLEPLEESGISLS